MFQGLGKWLFRSTEYKVLVIGNDASGKTSLLYRMKLGEFVTTIPTIGFNVETIEYPRGWQWTFWDVGGCDKIQPLLRHYLTPETLVLFIHDCADDWRPGVPDWLRYFLIDMDIYQTQHIWVLMNKQDLLPPDTASKIVKDQCQLYEQFLAMYKTRIKYKVLDHKLSAKTGEGVLEVLGELYAAMSGSKIKHVKPGNKLAAKANQDTQSMSKGDLTALIEKEVSEDDLPDPQFFWASFLAADLPRWDHRCHLKAGYLIVLDSLQKGESIFDAADTFITHLRRLREALPDRFRNTEHRTMTIFWLLQLQLAIWNYKIKKNINDFPSPNDFNNVLLLNPELRNTGLWALYYSKDHIFNPQAREAWTIPDLQQFPVLEPAPVSEPTEPSAQEDPNRLLRFAFAITQHILSSNLRRGEVIKEALASLQTNTIRLRAKDTSIQPYSETQTYFWIQIVHAALKSLEAESSSVAPTDEKPTMHILASEISFASFSELFRINPTTWKDYYSGDTWDSVRARMEFVPPDIKPLPNIVSIPSQAFKMEL